VAGLVDEVDKGLKIGNMGITKFKIWKATPYLTMAVSKWK
jgi:hypothetical protein